MRPIFAVNNAERLDRNLFSLLILLFFVSFFNESPVRLLYYIGTGTLLLIPWIVVFRLLCIGGNVFKGRMKVTLFFALFFLLQLAGLSQTSFLAGIKSVYRTVSLFLIMVYAQEVDCRKFNFNILHGFVFLLMIIGYITLFFFTENNTNICFGNLNAVGVIYFTLAMVYFCIRKRMDRLIYYLYQLNFLLLIIISNTRTALLLFVLFFLLCFVFTHFRVRHLKILYGILLACVAAFIVLYYNIDKLPIYSFLDEISMQIFGKHLDSGRPRLWQLTVATVGQNWLFGLGTGIDLADTSPHSSYFDFYLQSGLAGIIVFIGILYAIFSSKGKAVVCKQNKCYVIMMFVILFYNALGIIISRPGSTSGLLMWFLLSLPFVKRDKEQQRRQEYADKLNSADL